MNVFEEIPNFDNQSRSEQVASLNQYFSAKWHEYLQENKRFLSLNHDAARIEKAEFNYFNTQEKLNAMHYAGLIDRDAYKRQSDANWAQCEEAFKDCFEHRKAPTSRYFYTKQTNFVPVRMHGHAHAGYRKEQRELNSLWNSGAISRKDYIQKSKKNYENCLGVFINQGTNNYPPDISECKSYDDKKPKSYTRDLFIISQLYSMELISEEQYQFCVSYLTKNTADIGKSDILPNVAQRKDKARAERTALFGEKRLQLQTDSSASSIEIQAPNLDSLFSEPQRPKRKQNELSLKEKPKKKGRLNDLTVSIPSESKGEQSDNVDELSGKDKYNQLAFKILMNSHVKSLDNSVRQSQGLGNLTSNPDYYFHQSVKSEQDAMNFLREFWSDGQNCKAVEVYHSESNKKNKHRQRQKGPKDSAPACISFVSTSVSISSQEKSEVCYVALSGHKHKPGRREIMELLEKFIDALNKKSETHYELVYGDIENYNETLKLLIASEVNTQKACAEKYFGSLLVKLYYEFGDHFTVEGITNCGFYPFDNTTHYGYGNTSDEFHATVQDPQKYNDDEVGNQKDWIKYDRYEKMTMHLSLAQDPMNTSEADDDSVEADEIDVAILDRDNNQQSAFTRPCCKECCAVKPAVMKLINFAQKYGHGAELGADRVCTSPVANSLPHYPHHVQKYRVPGSNKDTITELGSYGLFGQFKETRKFVLKQGSENEQQDQNNLVADTQLR
jgi:hypothetical protein